MGKYKYKTQLGLFVVSKKMASSTDWRKSRAGWWLGEGGSPCSTGLLRWASLRKWGLNRIVRDEDIVMKTWENIRDWENCCRNGDPLPGPESGLFNTRKWIVGGDTQADKAKDCWKGCPGRKQAEGTEETSSAMWLCYVGFMVMELDSELSLVSHFAWPVFGDSGSFQWRVHHSAKMDSSGGLWEVGRTCGISFWPFPNSSGLLVALFCVS